MGESLSTKDEKRCRSLRKTHAKLADENHNDPREAALISLTADSLTEDRPRETMTAISDGR